MKRLLASAALLALAGSAHAAISVGSSNFSYSQNFDTLASPAVGGSTTWVNDSSLPGWSAFKADGASAYTAINIGTGTDSTHGSIWDLGSTAAPADRALGIETNFFSAPVIYIAVGLQNTSGVVLSGINLSFDGEQYRNGAGSANTMVLQYGIGAGAASVSNWVTPGGNFNWATPVTGGTAAAIDGNVAGLSAGHGGTILTTWNPGDTLWVRWSETFISGQSPMTMAIDNVSINAIAAVPEPGSYALMLAGLGAIGFLSRRRSRKD